MPRLAQLLDVEKCKNIVNSYFEKQLKYNISINNYKMHYPIKRALLIVQFYRVFQLVIIIFAVSYFLGIFWHIIVKDIEPSKEEEVPFLDVY